MYEEIENYGHSDYEFWDVKYPLLCCLCTQDIWEDEQYVDRKGYMHTACYLNILIENLRDYMKRRKYKSMKYHITKGGMTYWNSMLNNGRIRKREISIAS